MSFESGQSRELPAPEKGFDHSFIMVAGSIESLRGQCRAACETVRIQARELQETRELVRMYRKSHKALISALSEHMGGRHRVENLLLGDNVWPCELCCELHPDTTQQDAVTCRGCERRMCREAFQANPQEWYEEFDVTHCDDCDERFDICGDCILREANNPRSYVRACGSCGGICCKHDFRDYHDGCQARGGKVPRN